MNRMSRKEWLLLSRYLDDDLSEEQRQRIENRLQADDAFKAAYEELLHTRRVLRSVRPHKVPHSYVLNEAQVRSTTRRATTQLFFQYSSAIAAMVAVLALAVQLFSPRAAAVPVAYDAAQPEVMLQEAAPVGESIATATPPIIIWNPGYAAGKGGGGGDAQTYTVTQPTPETSTSGWGVGGGAAPESAAPLEEAAPMQEDSMAEAAPADESLAATAAPKAATNPILGVAPQEEQGEFQAESPATTEALRSGNAGSKFNLNYGEIAMVAGFIALACGAVALILHHKKY